MRLVGEESPVFRKDRAPTDTGVRCGHKKKVGQEIQLMLTGIIARIELITTKSKAYSRSSSESSSRRVQDDEQASRNGQDDLDASHARERAHAQVPQPRAGRHKTGEVVRHGVGQQCAEVLNNTGRSTGKKAPPGFRLGER